MPATRHALRQRREQLDLSQEQVAILLGVCTSAYRAYEAGTSSPRVGRRRRLAEILEWSRAQLNQALDGSTEAVASHAVPGWLGHLASLEQGASQICTFEATTMPGLLQTADYATAVESADAAPLTDEDVARRVQGRLARQAVLDRQPDPLHLRVVLDESILHRIAGDRETMAGQLDHLVAVAQRPNIDLRILPLNAGVFVFGSFALLASPDTEAPYMVVVEERAGAHYLDRAHELNAHTALFEHLTENALTPAESVDLICTTNEERYRR